MASIKIILFEGKELTNGEHPVMLRIIKNRKTKYIALGYSCTKKYWNSNSQEFRKGYPNHSDRNVVLAIQKSKAHKLIDAFKKDGTDYALGDFVKAFRADSTNTSKTFYQFAQEKLKLLKESRKTGNYKVYDETLKSLLSYTNDKSLTFNQIDLSLLEGYEAYLRGRGGTNGGISIKMRTIRALYNDAIKKGIAKREKYPFTNYSIAKLKGNSIKKALSRSEVSLIEHLDLETYPHLIDARHYFVFSYYTRGMNFKDMMLLKWSDIEDDRIYYIRSKTGKPLVVKILPPVAKILAHYKAQNIGLPYVFTMLMNAEFTAYQFANRKKKLLARYNKQLKELAEIIGITKQLTSYVARHSFATNLKNVGISIAVISESLGHSNQAVTETYLKSFQNDVLDEASEMLLNN